MHETIVYNHPPYVKNRNHLSNWGKFLNFLIQSQECMKLESIRRTQSEPSPIFAWLIEAVLRIGTTCQIQTFPCTSIDVSVHYAKYMCCSEICIDFSIYRKIFTNMSELLGCICLVETLGCFSYTLLSEIVKKKFRFKL